MRKSFISKTDTQLSIRRQAKLLGVNRNRLTPAPRKWTKEELEISLAMDKLHMKRPYYGSRRIHGELTALGWQLSRGRVRRLMKRMGLTAIYPKPRTSIKARENKVYPYLLRGLEINRPNQVWCTDITYIPMATGFAYLIAIMDWHSRAVLSWKISNTMDTAFCVEALKEARQAAGCWPEIMNTDQGSQFTSDEWVSELKAANVKVSMDGKGCWVDNVFIERLWRSLKYEDIYLREYLDVPDLESGVREWMNFYNHERRHQSLGDQPPWTVHQPSQAPLAA